MIFTVYRRYHELNDSLTRLKELSKEFHTEPDIYVVWAQPLLGHVWIMSELQKEFGIKEIITREKLPGEGGATSYPESHSIRCGLNRVKQLYKDTQYYTILQTADIFPNPGTYGFVDRFMQEHEAVLFHWENPICHSDIWHTNFFAVSGEEYWPPLSPPGYADTLEAHWGKELQKKQLPGIYKSHNSSHKKFTHEHKSETLASWALIALHICDTFPLMIKGHLTLRQRLSKALKWIVGVITLGFLRKTNNRRG